MNAKSAGELKASARIIIATFLPHFSTYLVQASVGPLAPFIQKALDISRTQIGFITAVNSIGWIVMGLLAGGLVERTSIRLWVLWVPIISGVLAFLFAGVTTFWQAILIFTVMGFVYSFLNPATTKAVVVNFTKRQRGTAISIKQTGVPAGVLFAAAFLPVIAITKSWQTGMVFVGVVNILAGLVGWLLYKERAGIDLADYRPRRQGNTIKRDLTRLMRNREFIVISTVQAVYVMCQYVLQSYLVLFLYESVHYSVVSAGLVMSVAYFSGIVGRVIVGLASDFIYNGRRIPILLIAGYLTVAGIFGLAFIGENSPNWLVWIMASIAGAGSIGFAGTSMILRAELAGKKQAATATGLGMAIAGVGILLGPPLFGLIVDSTGSYSFAWALVALVTLASTWTLRFVSEEKEGH